MIQPVSRAPMTSEWSQWMLIGAESARFAFAMTIGSRMPAAMWSSSHMSARPWLDVAVMTRAPAAEAPTQALIAECSDSTVTYSVCTSPLRDVLRDTPRRWSSEE